MELHLLDQLLILVLLRNDLVGMLVEHVVVAEVGQVEGLIILLGAWQSLVLGSPVWPLHQGAGKLGVESLGSWVGCTWLLLVSLLVALLVTLIEIILYRASVSRLSLISLGTGSCVNAPHLFLFVLDSFEAGTRRSPG